MVLAALKQIRISKIKPGNLLGRLSSFRPRSDGMDFCTRPIFGVNDLDNAVNFVPPDRVTSFMKAKQANISPLAKTIFNNLSISRIEPDDREKLSALAKCQYKKFKRIYTDCYKSDKNFEKDMYESTPGLVIDPVAKEFWTPMTISPTGLVSNYEVVLNGVAVGYLQFMEKSKLAENGMHAGKLEVETAFNIKFPEKSAQVTDLSLDPAKMLWALNLRVLSAENLGKLESEIEDGVLVYMAGLLLTTLESPHSIFTTKIESICFIPHVTWVEKLSNLGILTKENVVEISNYNGKYFAMPMEYLRVVNLTLEHMREVVEKMEHFRDNNNVKNNPIVINN